jgi:CheY-like chemotaxis protein
VAAVAELLSARAEERGLELAIAIAPEVPSSLLGDPSRVRQVLMNLVGNAIKFTDEGHVLIEAGVRDGHLRIAISDTGPGIPAEKHALLFQRFSQVESSTTRRHGGTGLGLAISKQLVELMGGRIGLENSPEQGSTFWFTLPLGANVSGTTPPTPSLGALHVLGVNLAEVNQRALARQLTAWGCHFRATPAERAITELASAAAAGRAWDLVIADLAEPSAALARLVRTIRTGGSWPVPAILGLHRRSTPAGFFQDACDSTLVKPIAVASSLLSSVQAALAARHRAPEAARLASLTAPAEPQVLLAQDDGASTMFTTRLLERAGCQVVNARNGSDALALARRQPFQLLLVDCHLPDPDGLAVARALRLDPGASGSVRIIGLKSDLSDADRENCRAAGMDDCHEKPLRGEGLKNLLDRWLPPTARPDSQT